MEDIWAVVPGYEGIYEVSCSGRIRSLYREQEFQGRWGVAKMRFPAKEMLLSTSRGGYKYVALSKNSVSKKHLVHRIVMEAFVGKSELQVNHKDGDKTNNHLSNLEYCTSSENLRHCIDVLGKKRGEGAGVAKLKESDVIAIRNDPRKLREIAKDYGVTLQAIHLVKKRKNWSHVN